MAAELAGLYIVIVAGTNMLPQRLSFKNWERWMRAELVQIERKARRLERATYGLIGLAAMVLTAFYCAWR